MTHRKIIHIDMDCFYAAVEVRDNPNLRGKPVAVGGFEARSVVATCNYEARKFGIHSALPMKIALSKCPQLEIVSVHMSKYQHESKIIRQIFSNYTDKVEPLSLDEAYLDVSNSELNESSATLTAHQIRTEIYETTGLTASAGIGPNKLIAKIASDWRKPNGQFTVPPEQVQSFIAQLPIEKIWGIGKVTRQKLNDKGIFIVRQLLSWSKSEMVQHLGQFGIALYSMIRGVDNREVKPHRKTKSVSLENTFEQDLTLASQKVEYIDKLFQRLFKRLESKDLLHRIKKCSLKIRHSNFKTHSAEISTSQFSNDIFKNLFHKLDEQDSSPVRLIGITVGIVDLNHIENEFEFEDVHFNK